MKPTTEQLTAALAQQLLQNRLMICSAESCTGGLIAKTFTDLAGSSAWFERGFVTYSNQAKIDMLGVKASTLEKYGAVSEQVAAEMASGALQHSLTQLAIAVTGIAGPDGGTELKPVGTVCFGFAYNDQIMVARECFAGDRQQVREHSLYYVLNRVNKLLIK